MKFEEKLVQQKIGGMITPSGIQVSPDTPFRDVIKQLQQEEKFCAVVVDHDQVVGVFTEQDALHRGWLKNIPEDTPIQQLMTTHPVLADIETSLATVIRWMYEGNFRHLPVVNAKKEFVGLASVRDIVSYLAENYPVEVLNQPPIPDQIPDKAEGA